MTENRYYLVRLEEVILHSKKKFAVQYRNELRDYLKQFPRGKDRNDLKRGCVVIPKGDSTQLALSCIYNLYHLLVERSLNVIPHSDLSNQRTLPFP